MLYKKMGDFECKKGFEQDSQSLFCMSAIDIIIEILSFAYLTLAQHFLLYYVADIYFQLIL